MTEKTKTFAPKLSHIGIQSYDLPKIVDWYCKVLNAHIVFQKPPFFTTITNDGEHHRIAFISLPGKPRGRYQANPEIMHVAFEMPSVFALLENYERIRDLGIVPEANVNHGATLSCYYRDPDGNQCELFCDSFPTKQECTDWFFGPEYSHNFGGGILFDPEALLVRMRAGASAEELLAYPSEEGLKVDIGQMVEHYQKSVALEIQRHEQEILAEHETPAA